MKVYQASLINALTLIGIGGWGVLDSSSKTAYLPVLIGVLLLIFNKGIRLEKKVPAHIVVLLTFLFLFSLYMPLKGAMGREDSMGVMRIYIMMASCVFAIVFFIKSFKDARKNK